MAEKENIKLMSNQIEMGFMDQNPVAMIIVDKNGDLKYLNPASLSLLKMLQFDLKDFAHLLPPGYRDIIHNCRAAGVTIPTTRVEYPDMVILWSPFFGKDYEEVVYQGFDITQLYRKEIALRIAKDKAEDSEKLKDAFLDNMSHEIRTPLNSLLGFTNLVNIELRDKLNENQLFYFELIAQSGIRLERTVNEILDISRFTSGTYHVKNSTTDIIALMKQMIDKRQAEIRSKGLELELRFLRDSLMISTDEYCITQAVSQLIDNAIKYTDDGHLLVGVNQKAGQVEIRIEDTGSGMDDISQRQIFIAFNQGSMGISKQHQGIGLGLSLVRAYLDAIGATIDLDSELRKGSRFKISIPNWPEISSISPN